MMASLSNEAAFSHCIAHDFPILWHTSLLSKEYTLPTRREFTTGLAALAALPLTADVQGADEATAGERLVQMLRLRYGRHIDEQTQTLAQLRARVQAGVQMGDALRNVPLVNADEPDFVVPNAAIADE